GRVSGGAPTRTENLQPVRVGRVPDLAFVPAIPGDDRCALVPVHRVVPRPVRFLARARVLRVPEEVSGRYRRYRSASYRDMGAICGIPAVASGILWAGRRHFRPEGRA